MQEKLFFETVQHASAVLVSIALQLCLHSPMGAICKNPGPSSKAIHLPSNHLQVVQRFPKVMLSTERPSQSCNLLFFYVISCAFVPEIALELLILFTRHILRNFQKEHSTPMLMHCRTEESFWWGFFFHLFFLLAYEIGLVQGGECPFF